MFSNDYETEQGTEQSARSQLHRSIKKSQLVSILSMEDLYTDIKRKPDVIIISRTPSIQ